MKIFFFCFALAALCYAGVALASSHSEAPGTAATPSADITDLYVFRSYEEGREDRLVILLNAYPLQKPFGGPNYYTLSDDHFFEIHISNDGDATEDITFQFFFGSELGGVVGDHLSPDDDDCDDDEIVTTTKHGGIELMIGDKSIAVPLKVLGRISASNPFPAATLNWKEYYQINYITGGRDSGNKTPLQNGGSERFEKPFDYTGEKAFGNSQAYEDYAQTFMHNTALPQCADAARVWVGQRDEPFHVNLGAVFDLVNFVPVSSFSGGIADCDNGKNNDLKDISVTTIALEVPISCLRNSDSNDDDVLSVWSSVRKLHHGDDGDHVAGTQTARMGQPLINELVIGLRDKFLFNMVPPTSDLAVIDYVTHPTLPAILNLLFLDAVRAELDDNSIAQLQPTHLPRNDLVVAFLTGVPGLTLRSDVQASEQIRVNVTTPVVSRGEQNRLGVIGGDVAGFPNSRRPGDDVVDIALRVMMGALCHTGVTEFGCTPEDAPFGTVPFTDGAPVFAEQFGNAFPFFNTPAPGSVTDPNPGSCDIGDGSAASSLGFSAVVALSLALLYIIF